MSISESLITATVLDQLAIASEKENTNLFITFFIGGAAYVSLRYSVKKKGMAVADANWNILSTISATIIGYLYYKEQLQMKELAGIGLGCISLYLMY